jgi:hypothetical protein
MRLPIFLAVSVRDGLRRALNFIADLGIHQQAVETSFFVIANGRVESALRSNKTCNRLQVLAASAALDDSHWKPFYGGEWATLINKKPLRMVSLRATSNRIAERKQSFRGVSTLDHHASMQSREQSDLPNLDDYLRAVRLGRASEYLADVTLRIPQIIKQSGGSRASQKNQIPPLTAVLSYSTSTANIFAILTSYLASTIRLIREDAELPTLDRHFRELDSVLYMIFELTPSEELISVAASISSTVELFIHSKRSSNLFVRALRQSYRKTLDLITFLPSIRNIIAGVNSDDGKSLALILCLFADHLESRGDRQPDQELERLFGLTSQGLVALIRDLRRLTVSRVLISSSCERAILDWISRAQSDTSTNNEAIIRLMALHAVGYLSPRALNFSRHNWLSLGMTSWDIAVLSALAGYPSSFILETNRKLISAGFRGLLPLPAQNASINKYFKSTLDLWARSGRFHRRRSPTNTMPLVSVIVTVYNPDLSLLTLSLKSILQQSYRRLQIIVIDDNSRAELSDKIEELTVNFAKACDIAIVYRRNRTNIGQYASRNEALKLSCGEFIAIQDDDDISHVERVEAQIGLLLRSPMLKATRTQHLRVSDSGKIQADGNSVIDAFGDAPATFIWRREVFEEIGEFICTKTRGDIEFRNRLTRYYGAKSVGVIEYPLLLVRGSGATVSASKEYYFRSAVSAFRYTMNSSPSRVTSVSESIAYVPVLLR